MAPKRPSSAPIVLIGTLDTKGEEFAFLRSRIEAGGSDTLLVDLGILGEPALSPDVTADEVARSGGANLTDLRTAQDKSRAIEVMARGAALVARELYDNGRLSGIVALGGGQGSHMASAAMRALPIGVPKVLVSTAAAIEGGSMAELVGTRDLMVMNSVVDISGLNGIARAIISNAASAVLGMVAGRESPIAATDAFRVSMTMFGVTTPCVTRVRHELESDGFEALVFAATGAGDRAMEDLIGAGLIDGVIDVTPSQVGQDLIRQANRAGTERLETAGRRGLPQVIAPGGLDLIVVNDPLDPLLKKVDSGERRWLRHNPSLTVLRPTVAESRRIGELVARKLNAATGPVTVVIPLGGFSEYSGLGAPLHDPDADAAIIGALADNLNPEVSVIRVDCHINDDEFADELVAQFLRLVPTAQVGEHRAVPTPTASSPALMQTRTRLWR